MKRLVVLALFGVLIGTGSASAQADNWRATGRMTVPIVVDQTLIDFGPSDNVTTVQIRFDLMLTCQTLCAVKIEKVAADGTTVLKEQGMGISGGTQFDKDLIFFLETGERIRIRNVLLFSTGAFWLSAWTR